MQSGRYVVSMTQHVVPVNDNCIAVVSSMGRFNIKGTGMSIAIMSILEHFKTPTGFDDVISALSSNYSEASLIRLLDLLLNKGILIDEHESGAITKHDKAFLEKTFFYTLGGKSLLEIIKELASLSIGIISTSQMTDCLLNHLSDSKLLSNFHVYITDTQASTNSKVAKDINITNHSLCSFDTIVENSDLIITGFNYDNHYIFNQINELCFDKGKKWLRIVTEGANAEIGPLFVPGETCCYSCLRSRRRRNMTEEDYVFDDLFTGDKFYEKTKVNPIALSALHQLNSLSANIASSEAIKYLLNMKCNLLNQILTVSCLDFHSQKEYIYKNYMCPVCVRKDVMCV